MILSKNKYMSKNKYEHEHEDEHEHGQDHELEHELKHEPKLEVKQRRSLVCYKKCFDKKEKTIIDRNFIGTKGEGLKMR